MYLFEVTYIASTGKVTVKSLQINSMPYETVEDMYMATMREATKYMCKYGMIDKIDLIGY